MELLPVPLFSAHDWEQTPPAVQPDFDGLPVSQNFDGVTVLDADDMANEPSGGSGCVVRTRPRRHTRSKDARWCCDRCMGKASPSRERLTTSYAPCWRCASAVSGKGCATERSSYCIPPSTFGRSPHTRGNPLGSFVQLHSVFQHFGTL